tara:strand:+ start:463 stop:921 length:459 start_codon:yes stop_codon:yes gene_type:complete
MTQALSFLPVFVGPAVNNLLYGVVDVLAKLQRPGSFRRLTYTKASNIFLFQLVNTGLTPLLVALFSLRSQRQQEASAVAAAGGDDSVVPPYDYQLDKAWYELASGAVLLTIVALAISSGGWPFVAALIDTVRRRRAASAALQPYIAEDATLQ